MVTRLHNVTREEFNAIRPKAQDIFLQAFSDLSRTAPPVARTKSGRPKYGIDYSGIAYIALAYQFTIQYYPHTRTIQVYDKSFGPDGASVITEAMEVQDDYYSKAIHSAVSKLDLELAAIRAKDRK